MADTPQAVANDERAPEPERYDAQLALQKAHMPATADLIPSEAIKRLIDYARDQYEEQELEKAAKVIPFPGQRARAAQKNGMQSVYVDEMQVSVLGDFYEKPGPLPFEAMRMMCDQTPVLAGVILTRVRQVSRFTSVLEKDDGPGFQIRHRDLDHKMTESEKEEVCNLARFFTNCGWEFNPRARRRMRRDNFTQFMAKSVRDSLTMDSAPIETELRRNRSRGVDGFYAVDGSTIRLCSEIGYKGEDEIFALQVVQGIVRTAYDMDELIYEPRNPRADVLIAGYGMSETELLVKTVTGFLNAMTLNISGFSENAIPKGILQLVGEYDQKDMEAFRRYWNAMVKGANKRWTVPVMATQTAQGKAEFVNIGNDFNEMYFSKWMTFLASIITAIYGMAPEEINFESFAASKSSLSGSDTVEKLADSKDKGLRPLMGYYEGIFSDFILSSFSDKYVFRWCGLDERDKDKEHEVKKLTMTIDELRAENGLGPYPVKGLGDAPANPSLIGPWQQMTQQQNQDFGTPDDQGDPDADAGQFGPPGDQADGQDGDDPEGADQGGPVPEDLGKSLPGRTYRLGWS